MKHFVVSHIFTMIPIKNYLSGVVGVFNTAANAIEDTIEITGLIADEIERL